jgi:trehalose 6-phosphate phosphatase
MIQNRPTRNLLDDAGLTELRSFVDAGTLLAFDLDGTLAPIVADPSAIVIPGHIRESVTRLCAMATVVILTGRGREDALSFLGFEPRMVVGNHGAEGLPGWEEREREFRELCAGWKQQLHLCLAGTSKGIVLEDKRLSLSLHYRNAAGRGEAFTTIMEAIGTLVPAPERISGKFVENVVPQGAPRKGRALLDIMRYFGTGRALFVGDDATDEDVFRLRYERIFGVRVGASSSTAAEYYLNDQQEIGCLLREIIDIITHSPCDTA